MPGHLSFGLWLQSRAPSNWAWEEDILTARWGATVSVLPSYSRIMARNKIDSLMTSSYPISSSVFTPSANITFFILLRLIRREAAAKVDVSLSLHFIVLSQSPGFRSISTQHTTHSIQHTTQSTQHTAHSTQHRAQSTQHTAHRYLQHILSILYTSLIITSDVHLIILSDLKTFIAKNDFITYGDCLYRKSWTASNRRIRELVVTVQPPYNQIFIFWKYFFMLEH
jgi:hypothetical protein